MGGYASHAGILTIFAAVCLGQANDARDVLAPQAKSRVEALRSKFPELLSLTPRELEIDELCKRADCSTPEIQNERSRIQQHRMDAMDEVVAQIEAEVDRYITASVSSKAEQVDRLKVANGLKQIVSGAGDMQPVTFHGAGHTMIVAYSIQKGTLMGSDGTAFTVRAYRPKGDRMELVNTTGSDMNGYGRMSVRELGSPTVDKMWFLASGYMTGANGPNARLRVYACRAGKFTTEWMPANAWGNFTTHLIDGGFTLSWDYYRDDRKSRETYQVADDGLYRRP